jgi:hypothetical protein
MSIFENDVWGSHGIPSCFFGICSGIRLYLSFIVPTMVNVLFDVDTIYRYNIIKMFDFQFKEAASVKTLALSVSGKARDILESMGNTGHIVRATMGSG